MIVLTATDCRRAHLLVREQVEQKEIEMTDALVLFDAIHGTLERISNSTAPVLYVDTRN